MRPAIGTVLGAASLWCIALTAVAATAAAAPKFEAPPPKSPTQSLATIRVPSGYRVELVAAEPLIKDPVAIEWGADGKLWVAEMADYPLGSDGKMKPTGRIRYLEDTDGDGRYDKSTLLLDNVNFPNGVLPWRKGVLITAAPEIFYAEDTGGDPKADIRKPLYRGFIEGNPQLRVNGLQWGLDGWVYCANGWSGGVVTSLAGKGTVDISGRDLRILPDEGRLDALAGVTEFGRSRDDGGRWFGCDNSNPMWQYVLEDYYTRRNPHIAPPDAKLQIMKPTNPKVYPISKPQKRYHSFDQSGHFTSACAVIVYRDELMFPRDGHPHAFVCEPVHNLVHHEVLSDDSGVSYTARRPDSERDREFLASSDLWFRPVNVRTGPDGALWIVDMYRFMIEHPDFLPPEGKAELSPYYRLGEDKGRIYRVVPTNAKLRKIPRLDQLPPRELAAALDSQNGWQRDTVERLILERKDPAVVSVLERLLAASRPAVRIQALWTLEKLENLPSAEILRALADADPDVRSQALKIAESHQEPQIIEGALSLADDPQPKVRLQLALSLGAWLHDGIGAALAALAARDVDNVYITAAVFSSVNPSNLGPMLTAAQKKRRNLSHPAIAKIWRLAAAMNRDDLVVLLASELGRLDAPGRSSADVVAQLEALGDVLKELARRPRTYDQLAVQGRLGVQATQRIASALAFARRTLIDAEASEPLRIASIAVVGYDPQQRKSDIAALGGVLAPQTPKAVQSAAVTQIGRIDDPAGAVALLEGWESQAPGLRSQVLRALLSRPAWTAALLAALEGHRVLPSDIDAANRQLLLAHKDASLSKRAAAALALSIDADRQKVLDAHRDVPRMAGDSTRGLAIFKSKCSVCHKVGNMGFEVGPNLVSLSDKSPAAILLAVLDPSRGVETRYRNYIAQTADGQSFTGVLAAETGNSITLLGQEGKQQVILRSELDVLRSNGKSLMPEGLERDLSHQNLADILAYVSSLKADATASR